MKLKKITLSQVRLPMKFTFKTAKSELKTRDTLILAAEDSEGRIGYGECVAFTEPFYTSETLAAARTALTQTYLPQILKTELLHPFEIHTLFKEPLPMALAGLENALLDLDSKQKGVNLISNLFSEPLAPHIPRGAVIGDLPLPLLLLEIEKLALAGVRRIKLKINPQDGLERVRLARQHFPELTFLADANQSFTDWRKLMKFDDLGLATIEEPLAASVQSDYQRLRLTTPITLDESVQTLDDLRQLAQLPVKILLNIKIGRLGGLRQTREAIRYCRAHQIGFWIGSMVESGISKILHVQLAALAGNAFAGDLSDSTHYFEEDLIDPLIQFEAGWMEVPTAPGIGVSVNEAALARQTIRKEVFT